MSQSDQILTHLKRGRPLTALSALHLYGTMRLGARVWDLRREGHHITKTMVKLASGKYVARYELA